MPFCYEIHEADEMRLYLRTLGRGEQALFGEYMQTGFALHQAIVVTLSRMDRPLRNARALLDFASGYGRVVRFLLEEVEPSRVTVSDIYPEAVAFLQDRLGVRGFVSNADPDAIHPGGPYDLITCISLFTHLPRHLFQAWLRKLGEVLEPEGLLLLTTHGPDLYQGSEHEEPGFAFVPQSESQSLDSAIYGTTFVSRRWVERTVADWLPGRKVVAFVPKGANNHQDIVVVGPSHLPERSTGDITLPTGHLDVLSNQGEEVRFFGWGLSTYEHAPVARVRAFVNDELVLETRPSLERPDLVALGGLGALRCGFDATFPLRREYRGGVFSAELEDGRGLLGRLYGRLAT